MSEKAAAARLRVLPAKVRALGEAGEFEWREFAGHREYEREGVERHARRRERLLSMRAVCREYRLPNWLLSRLVEDGVLRTVSGAKGAKLVDPAELKPLIELRICPVCELPAPLGRSAHTACKMRTPAARERARQNISAWWASPASEPFREKVRELPCPNCGRTFTRAEHQLHRDRPQYKVFCSQSCVARYRWMNGIGLDAVARSLPPRARQRWLGRWGGKQGAAAGIEAGRAKGGRPPKATPEQQQAMLRLLERGASYRTVARIVFGHARFKNRVAAFANR
jgi:hypothetical protein